MRFAMPDHFDPYHVWLGIPPEEQPPHHYRLLGLRQFESNPDAISNALDQRLSHLRSVQAGKRGALSQQVLNEVSAAGVCLLDAARKKTYDEQLRQKQAALAPAHASSPSSRVIPVAQPLPLPVLPVPMPPMPVPAQPPAIPSFPPPAVSAPSTIPPAPAPLAIEVRGLAGAPRKRLARSNSGPWLAILGVAGLALVALVAVGIWWRTDPASQAATTASASGTGSTPAAATTPPSAAAATPPAAPNPHSTSSGEPTSPTASPPITKATTVPPASGQEAAVNAKPQPLKGKLKPATGDPAGGEVAASPPPFENLPNETQTPLAPSQLPTSPAVRKPAPAGDALAAAQEKARGIYEREFRQASKAPQKAALAQKIQADGDAATTDPVARNVLIELARKVFVQAGEVQSALAAAERLETEYDLPPRELTIATVQALDDVQLLPEHRQALAKTAIALAEEALAKSNYPQADKLSAVAAQSATRQKDTELRKDITLRRNAIARAVKEWNAVQAKLETLKTTPDDPAANLFVGKFFCLALEDFARGLPHLAKSGDVLWEPPAKLDLAVATGDAAACKAAAEAWEAAAGKVTDPDDKLAVQRREKRLWEQALPRLSGLDEVRAKKRLEDLRDVAVKGQPSKPEPAAAPRFGMVGRVINAAGKDAGLLVTYKPGQFLSPIHFDNIRAQAGNPVAARIVLEGQLVLEEDTLVQFYLTAATLGWNQLFVDDVAVKSVGAGQISSSGSVNVSLRRGTHHLRWMLNATPDFGLARLQVSRAATPGVASGPDLPVTVDSRLQAAAEKIPTTATIDLGRLPR